MFPTYYLGKGASDPVTYLGSNEVFGNYDGNSFTTLTPPTEAKNGDFLLLLVWTSSQSTYTLHADMRTSLAGWNDPACYGDPNGYDSSALYNNYGLDNLRIFYKVKTPDDDSGIHVQCNGSATFIRISAVMYAFENVHPTCPIIAPFQFGHNNADDDGAGIEFRFHDRRNKIVVLHGQGNFGSAGALDPSTLVPAPVNHHTPERDANMNKYCQLMVFAPDEDNQFRNLITGSADFTSQDGWAFTGSEVWDCFDNNNGMASFGLRCDTSTGRHHASRTVEVIAGQEYVYAATISFGGARMYMSVEIDGTEYGVGVNGTGVAPALIPDGCTAPDSYGVTAITGAISATSHGSYLWMKVTAPATGTATLRIGQMLNPTTLSFLGSTAYVTRWQEIAFGPMKGVHVPSYVGWNEPQDGSYPMICAGPNFPMSADTASTGYQWHWGFEFLHKDADIPANRLNLYSFPSRFDPYFYLTEASKDGLNEILDYAMWANATSRDSFWPFLNNNRLPHSTIVPVYPPALDSSTPDKLYCEVTIGTFYDASSSKADAAVAIGPAFDGLSSFAQTSNNQHPLDVIQVGTVRVPHLILLYNGTIYSDQHGTDTAYTSAIVEGDVIGIAVDFAAAEAHLYVNGSLIRTTTLSRVDIPFSLILNKSADFTLKFDRTLNIHGPFTYLPTGYTAWDWRNAA